MNKTIAILMGLQGSGKSTFYKMYLSDNFVRVNLDTLKNTTSRKTAYRRMFAEQKQFRC